MDVIARIDTQEVDEAPDQEPRTGEHGQRQGDLRHHQPPLQPVAPAAGGRGGTPLAQGGVQRHRAGPPRRRQAEGDARRKGDEQRVPERGRIDPDLVGARQHRRPRLQDCRHPRLGEEQPDRASGQRQQHALRQQLAHKAAASGPQCPTHCELPLARAGSGQQQVGRIHAPDDEDESHDRQQDQQRGPRVANDLIPQAQGGEALRRKVRRLVPGRGHHRQVRGQPRHVNAVAQAGDGVERLEVGICLQLRLRHERLAQRRPELSAFVGKGEAGRHYSHHRVASAIQGHYATDGAGVASEELQPKAVAQHHHGRMQIRRSEAAAQRRLHPEQLEERG
jgi:hypothetical protein